MHVERSTLDSCSERLLGFRFFLVETTRKDWNLLYIKSVGACPAGVEKLRADDRTPPPRSDDTGYVNVGGRS